MPSTVCSYLRRAALVCLAAILLAGCALPLERDAGPYPAVPLEPQSVSLVPSIQIEVVLYFPNQSRTKLAAESRRLEVGQGEAAAAAIVRALLEGPQAPELRPVGTGLEYAGVEVTTEIINVYLHSDPEIRMTNAELTAGKYAVATTLIDYAGVRGVNVMIDGLQTAFQEPNTDLRVPTGVLARATDLIEEFNTLEQKAAALNPDLQAALYFLDPAMRRVVCPGEEHMLETLVAQLQQGPDNSYNYQPVLDPGLVLLEHTLREEADGTMTACLMFNYSLETSAESYGNAGRLVLASLAYTICDFLPRVAAVEIRSQLRPAQLIVCRPEEFADLLGCRVQICLPNTPNGVTMSMVERVLPQAEASAPRAVLQAVFEGPVGSDSRDVWPAVPAGTSVEDVRDVYIAGDLMVVDFSERLVEQMQSAPPDDERTMLFAIINTLTSFTGVRRVLFLIEGERREWLASETICILDPLMRNPGLIKGG